MSENEFIKELLSTSVNLEKNIDKISSIMKDKNVSVSVKNNIIFNCESTASDELLSVLLQNSLTNDSVLIDHEIAYKLGQLVQENSKEFLIELMSDENKDPIVRHEAIEALGNFEDPSLISLIEKYLDSNESLVRETAYLAVRKLSVLTKENKYKLNINELDTKQVNDEFSVRSPAFITKKSFIESKSMFFKGDLWEKYTALLRLRDLNTEESYEVIKKGFEDKSALFRHEVAFVMGQLNNPTFIKTLESVLNNPKEEDVVRHEAAASLGCINTEESKKILMKNLNNPIRIVRESIECAIF
ncbi:DOHH [Hepatospora eriocheir]|uniref:DOHH n=1 Tax=Hepatospora eriocheir TaxID=1081669 RepID=A0A1X0QL52_9MICR|nr:DOHH [Hepatospora eriocheir]